MVECKMLNNWCTVTVAPTIEHQWWTLTDPCKPEVRPGALEESGSPACLAAPAMNTRDTTEMYIWRLDTGCGPTLYGKCHSYNTPGKGIITLESNPSKWRNSHWDKWRHHLMTTCNCDSARKITEIFLTKRRTVTNIYSTLNDYCI